MFVPACGGRLRSAVSSQPPFTPAYPRDPQTVDDAGGD
jgi:hypothetical protein